MRKLLKWIFVPMLVLALAVPASAEENSLRIRNVTAQKGETVYVTVELTETVIGDAVGVSYTYDEKNLTPVVESCSWVRKGVVQDFDVKNHIGVWTVSQSEDLKGGVCVLAFALNKRANFTKTQVSCTVTVKNSGKTVGVYTAEGKIIMNCEHTYGQWTDGGDIGHTRTCNLCQGIQTQSHQWNDGIVVKNPSSGENEITYTCQICGGTMTHATTEQATVPTVPEDNDPAIPTTKPGNNEPNQPDQDTSDDGHSQGEIAGTKPSMETQDHDHDHEEGESQAVDPHAGHNHTQAEQGENRWLSAGVIFAVIAAFLGIAVYIVKRKK